MTQHTPGPWHVVYRYEVEAEDGSGIGKANRGDDALLFAAAPDLLEALRELVTICQEDPSFCDPEHEPDSYAALKAAIALATNSRPAEGREP